MPCSCGGDAVAVAVAVAVAADAGAVAVDAAFVSERRGARVGEAGARNEHSMSRGPGAAAALPQAVQRHAGRNEGGPARERSVTSLQHVLRCLRAATREATRVRL
jgi:hypothetical protein